ncbi:MAG TPA: serine hydrolase domain-containing protein, partial [Clostridia bacterium]|nr:serine hydrolase domain-containing protein [Clostridia bacterium]
MKKYLRNGFLVLLVLLALTAGYIIIVNVVSNGYTSTFKADKSSKMAIKLDSVIRKYVKESKFSGSVLVEKNGNILLNEGYGYAKKYLGRVRNTPETKFLLGSITKTFTAEAVLQLIEEKKLSLDEKVTKYLPEYTGWKDISIRQLLNHTSGIPNYYSSVTDYMRYFWGNSTPEKIFSRFKDSPLTNKPGKKFNYSNTNYVILGRIIEMVSGESYADYLKKNIFEPLGLKNTGYEVKMGSVKNHALGHCVGTYVEVPNFNMSNFFGAGCIYSTTGFICQRRVLEPREDFLRGAVTPKIPHVISNG